MYYIVYILLEFIIWKIRHILKSVDSISQIIEHCSSTDRDKMLDMTVLSLNKLTV